MKPDRKEKIGKTIVEEFYWAGRMVVYVNNRKYNGTFEEATEEARIAS